MFNKNLMRKLREEKKMTTRQLGMAAGCSDAHISYLETGKREPSGQTLYLLSRALGCTMDELWIGE